MTRVVTRWKKTVRRRMAIGGAGLMIGAGILFAVAVMPASAHTPLLSGRTVCSNGKHVVTWSIGNDYNLPMTIAAVTATQGAQKFPVTGYHATVGASSSASHSTPARSIVPADVTGDVTLTVRVRWSDGFMRSGATSVTLLGPCMGPTTSTTPSTSPVTTPPTSIETTTSTVNEQGSTLPAPTTTSTVAALGSTLAPPTSGPPSANSAQNGGTPIAPLGGPSGPPSGTSITQQLPFTGSSYVGPIVGAGSLVLGGIAVAFGSARKRRRETV